MLCDGVCLKLEGCSSSDSGLGVWWLRKNCPNYRVRETISKQTPPNSNVDDFDLYGLSKQCLPWTFHQTFPKSGFVHRADTELTWQNATVTKDRVAQADPERTYSSRLAPFPWVKLTLQPYFTELHHFRNWYWYKMLVSTWCSTSMYVCNYRRLSNHLIYYRIYSSFASTILREITCYMFQIQFLSEEAIGMISSIDFFLQHGLVGYHCHGGSNLSGSLEWWSDTSMEGQLGGTGDKSDISRRNKFMMLHLGEPGCSKSLKIVVANLH